MIVFVESRAHIKQKTAHYYESWWMKAGETTPNIILVTGGNAVYDHTDTSGVPFKEGTCGERIAKG